MTPTRMKSVWTVLCDRIGPDGLIYTNTTITTENPWAMPAMVANEYRGAEDAAFKKAFKKAQKEEQGCSCQLCQSQ